MKCNIHVFLLNELYSQEFADKHHKGKASEDNRQYEWEDEMEISTPVKKVSEHKNEVYRLAGNLADGNSFSYPVSNMRLVKITPQNSPEIHVGCSESILHELKIVEEQDNVSIEIYLKDYEPFSNPIPGIYIGSKSFPKELIF